MTADLSPETKVRPPTRKELLADNRAFVGLVGELLHVVRTTADRSCCICGSSVGKQHKAGRICLGLANWRHSTQYKSK